MARFVTSIQLHKADDNDYKTLDIEMEKASFHLKRSTAPGKTPVAKRGAYNCAGNISFNEVADAVYRAVKKTGRDYSFTILNSQGKFNAG